LKLLLCSDLHADNYSQFSHVLDNGINSRLQACLDALRKVKEICEKKSINYVFFLGDLFNSRVSIPIDVYYFVYQGLKEVAQKSKVYLIVGNHDQFLKKGFINSVAPFETICEIIDKPKVINLQDLQVVCLPFEDNNKKNLELLESYADSQAKQVSLLLGHLGVTGAVVGKHEFRMKTELSVEDLRASLFKWVILGHYHKFQVLKCGNIANVVYVGSMLQQNFGESGETKYVLVFDSESPDKLSRIVLDAPEFLSLSTDEIDERVSGNYVKVTCRQSEKDTVLEKLKSLGARDFLVQVEFEETFKPRLQLHSLSSMPEIIEAYINAVNSELNKKKLKRLAEDIILESKNDL